MMKQQIIIILGSIILLSACKKETNLTGPADKGTAYVSFTNVGATARGVNVFVDDVKMSNAASINTNSTITGIYLGLTPGDHLLEVKDSSAAATFYHSNTITVAGGKSYAYIVYDTLASGRYRGILLTSDRNINPAAGTSKIRFLNLSPKSPGLDVWFVRREATVAKDSLKVFSYVPSLTSVAAPDAVALSAFTDVNSNLAAGAVAPGSPVSDYIIRVKLVGTNTILASTAATTIVNGRNYTFFTRGVYGTSAFGISSFLNN